MKLYDFIVSRLPNIDGFGNYNKVIDDDGIADHSVFKQYIREDHQGDIGIFIINNNRHTKYHGYTDHETEIQIIANCINGDIEGALDYLRQALFNIKNNNKSDDVWVKSIRCLNLRPVGQNKSGIHWCVLNINLKYVLAND